MADKDSESTKKAIKGCKAIFDEYLRQKNVEYPQDAVQLAAILKQFYAETRKQDGSQYQKGSLSAIRFGLNRHFKEILNVDITKDTEFEEANKVFIAQCVKLKKEGLAKTKHKPAIADEVIKRLYECGVFSDDNPTTLQNKVFFEVMLFFCRRGRQNLRQFKMDDFEIQTDAKGRRFVVKTTDELTKNHRENDEAEDGGIMMSNEGSLCPVASFEKYLSHVNTANDYLFQRPETRLVSESEVWYDNMVLGEHTLGKKMKVLSQQANLSIIYTNHSIRATTVTIFDRSGFEARHIMSVSSHRSESSIKNYCKTDQHTKAKMANSLMSVIPSGECAVTPEAASPPLLTDSQEEFLLRDLTVQTSNNQNAKQFNFYNCKVDFNLRLQIELIV